MIHISHLQLQEFPEAAEFNAFNAFTSNSITKPGPEAWTQYQNICSDIPTEKGVTLFYGHIP